MRLRSVRWCILLLFGTCTGGAQWAEDFSKLKLQFWTSDVQYHFVHSSKVMQKGNEMLLEFNAGQARLRFRESLSDVKNSNLVVNITVLGCKSKVTLNLPGKNVLLQEPNLQDCPDSNRISFVFIEPITHETDQLDMTLEVSGSQNSTSPTRHLLSGLEVDVKPVESNTPQVCEMHEDFSLRKLQFWENDELGPEVGWRQVGNETLLAWNLTNLKLNPRLYFNYQDQIDATSITVSYTIVGCKMKTFLYWNDVFVMDGPINCNGTYTNLEFVEGVLGPEDSLNFRLEISPLSNAKEILLSDLKVTFVAKQSESQPLISEIKTTTAANINVSESATTENTSKVNSPGSDDDDIMMWALLLGTFTAFVIVSIVVAILVCYLRHSTKIKVSSPFNQHANYSQVLTNEV